MTANPSSENQSAAACTQDVRGSGLSVASGSPLSFADAVRMARGCFDYSGGHRGQDLETYHHGIQTVLNVLEAAQKRGFDDTQVCAIYRIGRAAEQANTAYQPRRKPLAGDAGSVASP